MSLAFIFPGQGSQFVGMAKDLFDAYPEVRKIYDEAEHILQFPLRKISFEGPEEELRQTRFTQPAIFVHSLAMFALLKQQNLKPLATAGHSLGEYSALVAAEALTFEDGLNLVKLRGELMQVAGEKNPGTMAAVIGLPDETVNQVCSEASETGFVHPANYNSPGQIVISGTVKGVHRAMELAKANKARMVTELVVSGAFHSPLMKEALEGLVEALHNTSIQKASIPVYANVSGKPVREPEEIRGALEAQLLSPVLWRESIENMITDGTTLFYEVGPAKVLSGLARRIDRSVPCHPIGTADDLEALKNEEA